MGQIGFGSYRVSIRSNVHREALELALKEGCSLIDTSANYTDGESEELIGEVLSQNPQYIPLIVTKAGYIQGKNLDVIHELNEKGLAVEDLVDLGPNLKHSIHPEFLENQLTLSLKRLKRSSVDYFLLHNPEYYFKSEGATSEEYYGRLKKAFIFCEEEVKKGRIKAYGVSSNNFVLPINDPEVTDLKKIVGLLDEIKAKNFKMVQFPFNLIEIGALEKLGDYGEESLLDLCMANNFITVVNRPLNAFTQNNLIRLATYEDTYKNLDEKEAQKVFDQAMDLLKKKWNEGSDEVTTEDDFEEVELVKQFRELWKTLSTSDAVDQVYHGHLFPFVARVWGGSLTPQESQPFYKLMELSQIYARKNMSTKALDFKSQAQKVGLLPLDENRPFSVMAIETYLDYGFDYILVGMRKPAYVDQLKALF